MKRAHNLHTSKVAGAYLLIWRGSCGIPSISISAMLPGHALIQMERARQINAYRGVIGVGLHDAGHEIPPLPADLGLGRFRVTLGIVELDIAEKDVGLLIDEDAVVCPPYSWSMSAISGHSSLWRRSYSSANPGYSFILKPLMVRPSAVLRTVIAFSFHYHCGYGHAVAHGPGLSRPLCAPRVRATKRSMPKLAAAPGWAGRLQTPCPTGAYAP